MRRAGMVTLAVGGLAGAIVAHANEAPTLRFDPFRPPPASDERVDPRAGARGGDRFEPWLRSVVVAGEKSLANLGGEILAVGESTRGYRLVAVRRFEADFVKDGKRLTLSVEREEDERAR